LEAARTFGATDTVNAALEDPVSAIRDRNGGQALDVVFVTVGNVKAIEQASKLVRRGGSLVVTGLAESAAAVPVRLYSLVTGERRILGSYMGSTDLSRDVPRLVELYQQGRLKLDELVSQRYSLDQINEGIAAMERGEARRNVIVF
jgi:Zn-dependent alcohol dehydrogenase